MKLSKSCRFFLSISTRCLNLQKEWAKTGASSVPRAYRYQMTKLKSDRFKTTGTSGTIGWRFSTSGGRSEPLLSCRNCWNLWSFVVYSRLKSTIICRKNTKQGCSYLDSGPARVENHSFMVDLPVYWSRNWLLPRPSAMLEWNTVDFRSAEVR